MAFEKLVNDFSKKHQETRKSSDTWFTQQTCHVFSNEFNMPKVYESLQKTPSLKIAKKNNLAVLVGESFFLSLLPALAKHADTILLMDIDPRVLKHNMFMIECLRKASSRMEYISLLCFASNNNPLLTSKVTIAGMKTINSGNKQESLESNSNCILDGMLLAQLIGSNKTMLEGKHLLETELHSASNTSIEIHLLDIVKSADAIDVMIEKVNQKSVAAVTP